MREENGKTEIDEIAFSWKKKIRLKRESERRLSNLKYTNRFRWLSSSMYLPIF